MIFYLRMAWRSLRHTRGLTAVMTLALSLGIGTWYAQHQVFEFLTRKTPYAPAGVYHVSLERGASPSLTRRPSQVVPRLPSILLTPRDAEALLAAAPRRKVITFGARGLLEPAGKPAEIVRVRYATRDLFSLFRIPLVAGEPWSSETATEAVIDESVAQQLFGSGPAVALGQTIRIDGAEFRIVGVVARSYREPYHLYERFVPTLDAVYLPVAHAGAAHAEPDFRHVVAGGETGYVNLWVELATAAERDAYRGHARAITLQSAAEWSKVFDPGGTINLWPLLSAMCVATSIISLVRMLMAKFIGRRHDLGLLRAFGARRRAVMGQLLLEATLIGATAGVVGLAFGLALMPLALGTIDPVGGHPAVISAHSVVLTLGWSIGAALLAALYPAWHLSRGTPAGQLRGL